MNYSQTSIIRTSIICRPFEAEIQYAQVPRIPRSDCITITINFSGEGENTKIARDKAAAKALVYFENNPPAYVSSSKVRSM